MAAMSDYLENKIIDHIFRDQSYTMPTNLYIALCTAATADSDTGSTITEPSGNNYSRTLLAPDVAAWYSTNGATSGVSSGTGGATSNVGTITFPTASGSWGTISHVAICDASSAGNILFHGALAASKTVGSGDVFQFLTTTLSVTLA